MNIFSEMNGEFFYKKLVSRGRNVSMENAGNAESTGKNTCNKNNYSYKKFFALKLTV